MSQLRNITVTLALFGLLLYTRFVNLGWGLPYPMHPDERNMADSVTRLTCSNPSELLTGAAKVAPRNVVAFLATGNVFAPQPKIECLNPHFFAYGQLSLYIGYVFALILKTLQTLTHLQTSDGGAWWAVSFQQAVLGLRIWSAIASCILPFVMVRILSKLHPSFTKETPKRIALLVAALSPVLIQFAHFGTTEAVLMLWYALIVDSSLFLIMHKRASFKTILALALYTGLAIATKASSLLFLMAPAFAILVHKIRTFPQFILPIRPHTPTPVTKEANIGVDNNESDPPSGLITQAPQACQDELLAAWHMQLVSGVFTHISNVFRWASVVVFVGGMYTVFSFIVSFVFSPHNILSLGDLLGSMRYESDVGLGRYIAFYTRQFLFEYPLQFHLRHMFPFALGIPVLTLCIIGLLIMPFKKKENLLRFALLSLCFVTSIWYAKWTRFMAPIYPLIIIIALYTSARIYAWLTRKKIITSAGARILTLLLIITCLPGIAYVAVYTQKDVRFVASQWVYKNIPSGAYILSETANVVDIPIPDLQDKNQKIPPDYQIQYLSFNSYDVDQNSQLQADFLRAQKSAEYIFVPSRRVFYNHTCVGLDGKITTQRHSKEKCTYLAKTYPVLTKYYQDLFSGKLGFTKLVEFTSYPRITLLGKTILEFPDEEAEETFTVFDHPVFRIYKRSQANAAR